MDTSSADVATATTMMVQSGVSGGSGGAGAGGTLQYLNPDYMPPTVSSVPPRILFLSLVHFVSRHITSISVNLFPLPLCVLLSVRRITRKVVDGF